MFRKSILIFGLLLLSGAVWAGQSKIDPYLNIPLKTGGYKAAVFVDDASKVEVFIKTSDPSSTGQIIESMGGTVRVITGSIITASLTTGIVNKIAKTDEVEFIEGAKPINMKNDVAGAEINSAEVHSGLNLPAGYTGKGVIVGLIDTGIDFDHPDFRNENGSSRVISIWDQNTARGPAPKEIPNGYGTECAASSIADGTCELRDVEGHGTHVAGALAGKNDIYGGVAPDANIVAVVYDSSLDLDSGYADAIFSTKICEAAYYVFAKANSMGMPAVVNLSLGTHIGAHDGTSLFEQCLSGLVAGSAGRAIVAAAGNEYSTDEMYAGIHTGFKVDGIAASNFVILKPSKDRIYYIDLWGEPGADLSVGLAIHDGLPSGRPLAVSEITAPGSESGGSFLDGIVDYLINATEIVNTQNNRQHVGIKIEIDPSLTTPSKYSFDLIVRGKGSFDAWLFPDKDKVAGKPVLWTSISGDRGMDWEYVGGDSLKSVAIPATSPGIIAVAGYTSRNVWDIGNNCCQVSFELGNLLSFSSAGPSAAEDSTGFKPDITAPGGMIASALSSDVTKINEQLLVGDKKHILQAGTSMAAPFVSGTVALMFEANQNLTSSDVKKYITESAYSDDYVGETPNYRWGHGKLDTLAAIEISLKGGASGSFSPSGALPPLDTEAGAGSQGCKLMPESEWSPSLFLVMVALILIMAVIRAPSMNSGRCKGARGLQ